MIFQNEGCFKTHLVVSRGRLPARAYSAFIIPFRAVGARVRALRKLAYTGLAWYFASRNIKRFMGLSGVRERGRRGEEPRSARVLSASANASASARGPCAHPAGLDREQYAARSLLSINA